jgi:hypothetical protein
MLVDAGADFRDVCGDMPILHFICKEYPHRQTIEKLLLAGHHQQPYLDPSSGEAKTPLRFVLESQGRDRHVACLKQNRQEIELLIKFGAKWDEVPAGCRCSVRVTPFIAACMSGIVSLVDHVLATDATVDVMAKHGGRTCVQYALDGGNVELATELRRRRMTVLNARMDADGNPFPPPQPTPQPAFSAGSAKAAIPSQTLFTPTPAEALGAMFRSHPWQ